MSRPRIALVVLVDLDDLPGSMYTEDSALRITQGVLNNTLHAYNPIVTKAPAELQPTNSKGSSNR